MSIQKISSFKGDFEFLSNFYIHPVVYENLVWKTSEHAYQAAKTEIYQEKLKIYDATTPGRAKRLGQKVMMRPDWEDVKLEIMEQILRAKFSEQDMINKLHSTIDYVLIEGNNWHDNFWGDCSCVKCKNIKGLNHLGKLLMRIRGF